MNNERIKEFVVKASADEAFTFEGYLSTFGNADRVGDVIEHGAFDDSLKKKAVVPMLFNHDPKTPKPQIFEINILIAKKLNS